jgi:hypothetical protein
LPSFGSFLQPVVQRRNRTQCGVDRSLMARLDRLGPAKEVAQIGAVIGREFSYALASQFWAWHSAIRLGFDIDKRTVRRTGAYDDPSSGAIFEYQTCFDGVLPC